MKFSVNIVMEITFIVDVLMLQKDYESLLMFFYNGNTDLYSELYSNL